MEKSHLIGALCAAVIFGFITMSSQAAPNDPSGGECDGLDPSSGLFSLCIQAHSAKNRVEHLQSVGASENAIRKAQAGVDDAEAMFSELGGGTIPGLYDIGDTGPAGGIVFWVDGNGGGLEVAPDDLGIYEWGCFSTWLNASGTDIGTGKLNTDVIVNECAEINTAAKVANAYALNNFDDWFLPSKDELDAMYTNLHLADLGDFSNGTYWSSSEYGIGTAFLQHFGFGWQDSDDKDGTSMVRAVRAF